MKFLIDGSIANDFVVYEAGKGIKIGFWEHAKRWGNISQLGDIKRLSLVTGLSMRAPASSVSPTESDLKMLQKWRKKY